MTKTIMNFRNLHLIVTSGSLLIVGLAYGICPNKILPFLLNTNINSVDLNNVFKAIMGLYLGMAFYWIVGIVKLEHWRNATLTSTIFMGSLAIGRIISIIIDGLPSNLILVGTVLELLFMIWGIYNLKRAKY